jgi:alkylation response protein AidB-like acyl-CoA dehydrogenase
MPEQLTSAQIELAARTLAFAEEELLPRRGDTSPQAREAIVAAARDAGLFAMTQPVEYGGTAAGTLELTVVRDTLAATNAPFLGLVFGPGPGVLAGAQGPLKSSHLEPLLRGEKRGAFGFTEPDDAPAPTSAVEAGDHWLINGQKSYVTGGAQADFINTLVQIPGQGPGLVVIDTSLEGVELEKKFSSLDGSHHAAFRFTDVRVPRHYLIGTPGEGLPRAMRQIGDTRLAIAATCVGYMRWVDEFLTEHLAQPDTSGKPRGDKEGVRLRYAEARIKSYAARSMVYRTARLADSGANIVNEGISSKVFATETVGEVVDNAIQLTGGNALITGHPLEILYRQVRSLRLAEGGSDVLRLNLARGRLDLGKGTI